MTVLVLASLAFLAIHAVPATPARGWFVGLMGEGPYLGLFSFVSLLLLVAMGIGYGRASPAPALWHAGIALKFVIAVLMIVPFWLAVAGVTGRNPAAVGGGGALATNAAPVGVFTITRHPLMVGITLWAALHLLANPDLPSLVLFGSLILTALGGAKLQDRRKEHEIGAAWRRYAAQTSLVPLVALGDGRTRLDASGLHGWQTGAALALWALFLALHGTLFGASAL